MAGSENVFGGSAGVRVGSRRDLTDSWSASSGDVEQRFLAAGVTLRAHAEVVVALLVDLHADRLAALLEQVVQAAVNRDEAVVRADEDQDGASDRLDVLPCPLGVGRHPLEASPAASPGLDAGGAMPRKLTGRRAEDGGVDRLGPIRWSTRLPPRLTP